MDMIAALLGGASDPSADTAALADALRRQRRTGQALGLSTLDQVSAMGRGMADDAYNSARRTGVMRAAEQRRLDTEAYRKQQQANEDRRFAAAERQRRLDYALRAAAARREQATFDADNAPQREMFIDQRTGQTTTLMRDPRTNTLSDASGNVYDVDDLDGAGLMPVDDYTAITRAQNVGRGRSSKTRYAPDEDEHGTMFEIVDNQKRFLDGTPYDRAESMRRAEKRRETARMEVFREESTKELATKGLENLAESRAATTSEIQALDSAIDAIRTGANTGVLARLFPALSSQGALLESAAKLRGLSVLNKFNLKPVSDADMRMVTEVALPMGVDENLLKYILMHDREVAGRLLEANNFIEMQVRETGKMPTQEQVQAITYAPREGATAKFSFQRPKLEIMTHPGFRYLETDDERMELFQKPLDQQRKFLDFLANRAGR